MCPCLWRRPVGHEEVCKDQYLPGTEPHDMKHRRVPSLRWCRVLIVSEDNKPTRKPADPPLPSPPPPPAPGVSSSIH